MNGLAKTGRQALDKYDPDKGLKTIAVAEAAEKYATRAKDATMLYQAIEAKLTAQAEFVSWWKDYLKQQNRSNGGRPKKNNGNSNFFDEVYRGIGHRGSSFSDIDAVSHDKRTQRFLLQEFKREGESRDTSQHWMLRDLTGLLRKKLPEHFTVWIVERRNDGAFGWAEYGSPLIVISREELRARFDAWWDDKPYQSSAPTTDSKVAKPAITRELTADDITW